MTGKDCVINNRKKHERRRLRQAENEWCKRKRCGLCPYCKITTSNEYLCDECGLRYVVFVTDNVTSGDLLETVVWMYRKLDIDYEYAY